MKIEVDVKKRYFFSILLAVVIIAGIVGVFGYTKSLGVIPNPGHALNTIQGYFSGDTNLENSLGKFCQSDGTNCVSGSLDGSGAVFEDFVTIYDPGLGSGPYDGDSFIWEGSGRKQPSENGHPGIWGGVAGGNTFRSKTAVDISKDFDLEMMVKFTSLASHFRAGLEESSSNFITLQKESNKDFIQAHINVPGTDLNANFGTVNAGTWYKIKIKKTGSNIEFTVNDGTPQTLVVPNPISGKLPMSILGGNNQNAMIDYVKIYSPNDIERRQV